MVPKDFSTHSDILDLDHPDRILFEDHLAEDFPNLSLHGNRQIRSNLVPLTVNENDLNIEKESHKDKSGMSPDKPIEQMLDDHEIAKKIAASLRIPNGTYPEEKDNFAPSANGDPFPNHCPSRMISTISNPYTDPHFPQNPNVPDEEKKLITEEQWYMTTIQISVPFLIAGIGTIGAGLILSNVERSEVFVAVSELFILVPALLGLKGNLDMCLASRLSTQANLGNMTSWRRIMKMVVGNVALVQIQAIVAAIIVSMFAMSVGAIMKGSFVWAHALLLIVSSVSTAATSCFVLDLVMIAVILIARRFKLNPDNVATPLAASIGDLVTISVLSFAATSYYGMLDDEIWILFTVLAAFLTILPFWIVVVLKNEYTKKILTSGWVPVLSALFISGLGGLILDQAVDVFDGFTIFQPIINGIGGNLVSVQASRMSTIMHQTSIMGKLPQDTKTWVSPWSALFYGVPYAKTARILIGMAIPGHLIFISVADYIQWGYSTVNVYFMASYVIAAAFQIMILLYIAHIIIHFMWKRKIDPDNSAIPYLTALGDLIGSALLAAAFYFLLQINQNYGDY